jgi:hypothetical protein
MITKEQAEQAQKEIDKNNKILHQHEMQQHKCCVCAEIPTNYHLSIVGQIKFYVCENHFNNTYTAMGMGRMGLMKDREWIEIPYLVNKL